MQVLNSKSFLWMSFDPRMISRFQKTLSSFKPIHHHYFFFISSRLVLLREVMSLMQKLEELRLHVLRYPSFFWQLALNVFTFKQRWTLPQYCLLYLQCSKDHNDGNSYKYSFIFLNLVTWISLSFKNTTFNDGVSHKWKNSRFECGKWEIWENVW